MDSPYKVLINIVKGIDGTEESLNKAEKLITKLESEVSNGNTKSSYRGNDSRN